MSAQMDLFAQNQGIPAQEEQEGYPRYEQIEPKNIGERWIDEGTGDELIYCGAGRFESLLGPRTVVVKGPGSFFCQSLSKKVKLERAGDPNYLWQSVLEQAAEVEEIDQVLKWLEEEKVQPGNTLTWRALNAVDRKFRALRGKLLPKFRKKKGLIGKGDIDAMNEAATTTHDQDLAIKANRFLRLEKDIFMLSHEDGVLLLKRQLSSDKIQLVIDKAIEQGFKPDFEEGLPEASVESEENTQSEVESSTSDENAVDVDTADEGTSDEGEGSRVEIPMLQDGQQPQPEAQETPCSEDAKTSQPDNLQQNAINDVPAESVAEIPKEDSSPEEQQPPAEPENKVVHLIRDENGYLTDPSTGETFLDDEKVDELVQQEASRQNIQLPVVAMFDVVDIDSANIYAGIVVDIQHRIDDAVKYAIGAVNFGRAALNSLARRYNQNMRNIIIKKMKRRKKDNVLSPKHFLLPRGKVFAKAVKGGVDIFDKPEFQSWLNKLTPKECEEYGVEITKAYEERVTVTHSYPEVRTANFDVILAFLEAEEHIPGCRRKLEDEFGQIFFGEGNQRSGWNFKNVGKTFTDGIKKDLRYIGLTNPAMALPYKVEEEPQIEAEVEECDE